jgi:secondary thiamine-phosphate synthase enzyme
MRVVYDKEGVDPGECYAHHYLVYIDDDERGLLSDYEKWLEELAPHAPTSQYLHNRTGEDNADAHLKRQIMGRQVVVAVTNGRLDFGTWEQTFYGEFDGGRRKRVLIKITGDLREQSRMGLRYAHDRQHRGSGTPRRQ